MRPRNSRDSALNPDFPIGQIQDVRQLMAVAIGMEHEAACRYRELATEMRRSGASDMEKVFSDLAQLEADHEAGLVRLAERGGGPAPAPKTFAWQLPETFGGDGEGAGLQVLTPYRALSIAVRNEERAFAFYTYLAAIAADAEVRRKAEGLAHEELEHLAELRAMRRRAYHAELRKPPRRRMIHTVAELHAVAARLEARTHDFDAAAAAALAAAGDEAATVMRRQAERDAATAASLGGAPGPSMDLAALAPARALRLALKNAEEVFEAYMTAAEQATDEDVMREAQHLGEGAVARLALIRSQLAEVAD